MSGFCTSERAFGDYLTREETSELHKVYRRMKFKQFHYSNAAMDFDNNYIDFYSYYTRICTVYRPTCTNGHVYLCVYPFIYDANNFKNSPTTNKQMNKFLKEYIDAYITVSDLRYIYNQLINDFSVPSLKTFSGNVVSLIFSDMNYYISEGCIRQCSSESTQHAYCILNGFEYYATEYETRN